MNCTEIEDVKGHKTAKETTCAVAEDGGGHIDHAPFKEGEIKFLLKCLHSEHPELPDRAAGIGNHIDHTDIVTEK